MFPTRRPPSRTLPRNFTFHYNDDDVPQTPEPQDTSFPPHLSATPREPYRLRRRRDARQLRHDHFEAPAPHDVPIPTIEISDHPTLVESPSTLSFSHLTRFGGSPPRTPCAQIQAPLGQDTSMNEVERAETISQGESISRPSTACSGFSDSSVSSSLDSFPSIGDSFTSPETESSENRHKFPFSSLRTPTNVASPPNIVRKPELRRPTHAKTQWTEELDHHIWSAYMRYLQDPTHTPFKMLPGTAPPLGVCSRVVREAKRTWKGLRQSGCVASHRPLLCGKEPRINSFETLKPMHGGRTAGLGSKTGRQLSSWPRSDASTRRRLRELCKSKPTLSAHYNRLLSTRSPSPFTSSSSDRQTSAPREATEITPSTATDSFSRDMTVSLFSSTSTAVTAMHQITSDSATPKPRDMPSGSVTPRHKPHQKSRSLHNMSMGDPFGRNDAILASPFRPLAATRHTQPRIRIAPQTPATFTSCVESVAPVAAPLRTTLNLASADADNLALNEPAVESSSFPDFDSTYTGFANRRVRSRGFSLNDVSASSRRLSLLFEPPPELQASHNGALLNTPASSTTQLQTAYSLASPPRSGSARRLGSPFSERSARPQFNTFPRNFSSHSLEPTMETQEESLPTAPSFRS